MPQWYKLNGFGCPVSGCKGQQGSYNWVCSADNNQMYISETGYLKCEFGSHIDQIIKWKFDCGYHGKHEVGRYRYADRQGFTLALSHAVQLMNTTGASWVAALIIEIGQQYESNNRSTDFTGQGDPYMPVGSQGHDDRQYGPHKQTFADGQQAHAQTQNQLLLSVQASKQMVYEVFGNCVTMLEELEHRELKLNGIKPTERSDIYLPDQSKFDDATIQRTLDTQLFLLKTQLVSCNEEIKDSVKEELKKGILHWVSDRGEHIPNGITIWYASKMFEMLETGHTEYPKEFDQPPKSCEKDMHKAIQGVIQGQHHQSELDKKFKENPDKEAEAPKLRKSKGIDKADRVARAKQKMSKSVDNYRISLR